MTVHFVECDSCHFYGERDLGRYLGPQGPDGDIIPVLWFCEDCVLNADASEDLAPSEDASDVRLANDPYHPYNR